MITVTVMNSDASAAEIIVPTPGMMMLISRMNNAVSWEEKGMLDENGNKGRVLWCECVDKTYFVNAVWQTFSPERHGETVSIPRILTFVSEYARERTSNLSTDEVRRRQYGSKMTPKEVGGTWFGRSEGCRVSYVVAEGREVDVLLSGVSGLKPQILVAPRLECPEMLCGCVKKNVGVCTRVSACGVWKA